MRLKVDTRNTVFDGLAVSHDGGWRVNPLEFVSADPDMERM